MWGEEINEEVSDDWEENWMGNGVRERDENDGDKGGNGL